MVLVADFSLKVVLIVILPIRLRIQLLWNGTFRNYNRLFSKSRGLVFKYEARHHFDLKRVREEQSANFSVIGRNKVSF